MPDHIHMLVSIPPNEKVSEFMGYLKGKSIHNKLVKIKILLISSIKTLKKNS